MQDLTKKENSSSSSIETNSSSTVSLSSPFLIINKGNFSLSDDYNYHDT